MSTLFSFTDEKEAAVEQGILYQRIDAKIIKDQIGNIDGKTFFICGPGLFMAAMVANLLSLGVARSQIKMEEFSMIPDNAFLPRLKDISYAMAFSFAIFIISFSSILKSSASSSAAIKKSYDPILGEKTASPSNINTPSPVTTTPPPIKAIQPTPTPVYMPPAPIYTPPAPTYTPPAPTPVTGASPAR